MLPECSSDLINSVHQNKRGGTECSAEVRKGKPLLPPTFVSEHRIEEIKGLYVPFWLYDCDAAGKMRFDATKVKKWSTDEFDYTRTEHYMVVREGEAGFADVPVNGSDKMEACYMEAIEPFDVSAGKHFQQRISQDSLLISTMWIP